MMETLLITNKSIMKKITITLLLSLFLLGLAKSQICVTGNITLTTQSGVNNFISIYSGTCGEITGTLELNGSSQTLDS